MFKAVALDFSIVLRSTRRLCLSSHLCVLWQVQRYIKRFHRHKWLNYEELLLLPAEVRLTWDISYKSDNHIRISGILHESDISYTNLWYLVRIRICRYAQSIFVDWIAVFKPVKMSISWPTDPLIDRHVDRSIERQKERKCMCMTAMQMPIVNVFSSCSTRPHY